MNVLTVWFSGVVVGFAAAEVAAWLRDRTPKGFGIYSRGRGQIHIDGTTYDFTSLKVLYRTDSGTRMKEGSLHYIPESNPEDAADRIAREW